MKRYFTTPLLVFSVFGGVVTYFLVSPLTNTATAIFFSAIATLLLSLAIPMLFAAGDRKFLPLKKEITEPIVIDERVNYLVGDEIQQGFIVTTKDSLYVISSGKDEPVKFEIKRSDIKKISVTDDVYLNIFLDYDKCIRVFAGNCDELCSMLLKEGFGK